MKDFFLSCMILFGLGLQCSGTINFTDLREQGI